MADEEQQESEAFLTVLIQSGQLLVANGHPSDGVYAYSIKKLLYLADVHRERVREQFMAEMITSHMSRIAIATSDGKEFKSLIEKLSPKEE